MIKSLFITFFSLVSLTFCFFVQYVSWTFMAQHKDDPTAIGPWSTNAQLITKIGFYAFMILYTFASYRIFARLREKYSWIKKVPVFVYSLFAFIVSIIVMTVVSVSIVALVSKGYPFVPG